MKKILVMMMACALVVTFAGMAAAGDNPLKAGEKAVHKEFTKMIPKDKLVTIDDLYKKWQEVLAGKSKAILLDVRTHAEFDAFHIEGSSHIHAGHMYTIPKKIKDPNAEVYVYCRTEKRAGYVAGFMYKYGYKNVYYVVKSKDKTRGGVVGWAQKGHPFVNYFYGQMKITQYLKPAWTEKNCGNYIREFSGQRGEKCGKKLLK